MAKKTNDNTHVLKYLRKEFGENNIIDGNVIADRKRQIIPVSPSINIGLGGGVPTGSWVILAGLPKYGKSSLALQIAANAQQEENGEREVYYLNAEGRLKERDVNGIHNLIRSKFHVIESSKEKILSGKEYLTAAEKICTMHEGCVVIVDSFANLLHEKEIAEGIGTSTRGGTAVYLSQFCRILGNVVPVMDNIVIGITHLMANTGSSYGGLVEKGGIDIGYQVDVKMRAKKKEYWTDEKGKAVGQKNTWNIETSALNSSPNQEIISYLRYGYGLDNICELIDLAVGLGLIEKTAQGGWHTLSFLEKYGEKPVKAQGTENCWKALRDHKDWVDWLNKDVMELSL